MHTICSRSSWEPGGCVDTCVQGAAERQARGLQGLSWGGRHRGLLWGVVAGQGFPPQPVECACAHMCPMVPMSRSAPRSPGPSPGHNLAQTGTLESPCQEPSTSPMKGPLLSPPRSQVPATLSAWKSWGGTRGTTHSSAARALKPRGWVGVGRKAS